MKHSRIVIGLAASALLALGACGSDDESSDTVAAATTTSADAGAEMGGSAAVTDPTVDEPSTDGTVPDATVSDATVSDATATPETDGPDPGDPDFSIPEGTSEQCADLYNKVMDAAGDSSLDDPDSMRRFVEVFTSLKSDLPADLSDDLDVLATAYTDYAEAIDASGDPTSTDPEVVAALDALDSDEVSTADENISTYLDELCPTLAS